MLCEIVISSNNTEYQYQLRLTDIILAVYCHRYIRTPLQAKTGQDLYVPVCCTSVVMYAYYVKSSQTLIYTSTIKSPSAVQMSKSIKQTQSDKI